MRAVDTNAERSSNSSISMSPSATALCSRRKRAVAVGVGDAHRVLVVDVCHSSLADRLPSADA